MLLVMALLCWIHECPGLALVALIFWILED
jgi:hypothetical protein